MSKIMVYDVTELRMSKIIIFVLNNTKDDFLLSVTKNVKKIIFDYPNSKDNNN